MIDKLRALAEEYEKLQQALQDAAVYSDPKKVARLGKRRAELEPLVDLLNEYDRLQSAVESVRSFDGDPELRAIAEEEAKAAEQKLPFLEEKMRSFLVPKNPDDDKGVILEVRAGAGGEEAAIFASELLRMYLRYAEGKGWKTEILDKSDAESGGVKEASARIDGVGAFGDLKFESGVHRVQRIPATEAKGRVHTSTATVAVLPEAEEVDVQIRSEDLRIDTFRSGGAGGQNVNKVESAVRITHIPTGVVVACQTERSQQQNRVRAMGLLRSRLYAAEQERLAKERGDLRSGQIGSGDRSEKIRTYNFPQDRLTDHRLDRNFSNLPAVMEGDISSLIGSLKAKAMESQLQEMKTV
ncbi:MAG: peptide chain release factor 1 [Candidatus Peribacteraceae bacterium]|nr:peptide chain release factor 1 [Candidatus Peribacteraceae bacterium]